MSPRSRLLVLFVIVGLISPALCKDYALDWVYQQGWSATESARDIVGIGGGKVFYASYTYAGSGLPYVPYVGVIDSNGTNLWSAQLSTNGYWAQIHAAADPVGGYLYASSAWSVARFSAADGTALGTLNLNLSGSLGTGYPYGITGMATDVTGNLYVNGWADGGNYLYKRRPGARLWQQLDSPGTLTLISSLAADLNGNIYVAPWSAGLSKLDTNGNVVWTRSIDASYVATDELGDVYAAGSSLSRLDEAGDALWTVPLPGQADGLAADRLGNSYVIDRTPDAGGLDDILIMEFNRSGQEIWSYQFGTPAKDWPGAIWPDADGSLYISGATQGDLGAPNAGGYDMFVARFTPLPEPASLLALAGGGILLLRRRNRATRYA